jgi:predicted GNAT family acetyltransferase
MRLEKRHFSPPQQSQEHSVVKLGASDLQGILDLYDKAYPGNWFDPRMLATGQYLGIEDGGTLIAIAGIHVYSPTYQVAALGNITTHPRFRGKGLSTYLTAVLCRQLFQNVDWIGLNVAASNTPAIRCYKKIGFAEHSKYEEVLVKSREPVAGG